MKNLGAQVSGPSSLKTGMARLLHPVDGALYNGVSHSETLRKLAHRDHPTYIAICEFGLGLWSKSAGTPKLHASGACSIQASGGPLENYGALELGKCAENLQREHTDR